MNRNLALAGFGLGAGMLALVGHKRNPVSTDVDDWLYQEEFGLWTDTSARGRDFDADETGGPESLQSASLNPQGETESRGVGSKHYKDNISSQRPYPGPIQRIWNKATYGNQEGR
ncbi:hypothetical protein EJ06DRAFT_21070 [Trichodelitschia bisporula]|uniref:Uncharacterized protein n=1 Tax=Trichodelitschia bisporula TaxID=703511 RepID=A0A6G1IAL5_9PEZI|nr:hypothetical protein EJ06DRAFT_21070 [Trichodelitschia bisporula]